MLQRHIIPVFFRVPYSKFEATPAVSTAAAKFLALLSAEERRADFG
jgi:hypothetical protein